MALSLVLLAAGLLVLPGAKRRSRPAPAGSLPLALDLVSVALRAGQTLAASLEAAVAAAPAAQAVPLADVAALLRLGADPAEAWAGAAGESTLSELGRVAGRSALSGARLADVFVRFAVRLRRAAAAADETRAQRAGVLCAVPLAVCFLPSFVCLGVVPTLLGLLGPALPAAR